MDENYIIVNDAYTTFNQKNKNSTKKKHKLCAKLKFRAKHSPSF